MKLKEILKKEQDCLLFAESAPEFQFIWEERKLTKKGEEYFKEILECECIQYRSGNIRVLTDDSDRLNLLVEEFVYSVAGYIPNDDWEKLFIEL